MVVPFRSSTGQVRESTFACEVLLGATKAHVQRTSPRHSRRNIRIFQESLAETTEVRDGPACGYCWRENERNEIASGTTKRQRPATMTTTPCLRDCRAFSDARVAGGERRYAPRSERESLSARYRAIRQIILRLFSSRSSRSHGLSRRRSFIARTHILAPYLN